MRYRLGGVVVLGRRTLIRPRLVNSKTHRERGSGLRVNALAQIRPVQLTSFLQRRQTVVCTKHLSRLDLATSTRPPSPERRTAVLRGLETHRFPRAGRL